jgi:hypothetical protein
MSFLYKNSNIYLQKNSCDVEKEKCCYIFERKIFDAKGYKHKKDNKNNTKKKFCQL